MFKTFKEANSSISTKNVGYNSESVAEQYLKNFNKNDFNIILDEFPIIYWINFIGSRYEKLKVFDFGGNLGHHFFKFAKYDNCISRWLVCEVEPICRCGKDNFANKILNFTSNLEKASEYDIFLSSGAIQYVSSLSLNCTKNQSMCLLVDCQC